MSAQVLRFEPRPRAAPVPDDALLAACVAGDHEALGELYDRHHRAVWRFLGRVLGPGTPEIDDLVQSTFEQVWRGAVRFDGRAQVKSWIIGIAYNLARRHMRSGARRRAAMRTLATEAPASSAPEGRWQDRLLLEKLQVALQDLKPDLRATFVLCELEELSGTEVAAALNVRPGTVWRRLHEARKKLRAALEGGAP